MKEEERMGFPSMKKWVIGSAALSVGLVAFLGLSSDSTHHDEGRIMNAVVQEFSLENDIDDKSHKKATSQPHIFLVTVDDLGWNDVGYNSGDIPEATPYIKTLVKQGIKLTHYYAQPSCTPSRVSMMTGKYTFRNGFQGYELQHGDSVGVPLSNKMLPAYMKDLGYATIGFGKWNIGHCTSKYLPNERGFDHFLGYLCPGHGYRDFNCGMSAGYKDMIEGWAYSNDDGSTTYAWETGAQYEGTYDTEIYRDQSTMAIKKHFNTRPNTPLFMWIAQHGIHGEDDSEPIPPDYLLTADNKAYLKVLKKRLDEVGSKTLDYSQFFKMRMITASVLMSIDNALKQLIETLTSEGKLASSVVFVNSDNGGDVAYKNGHPGNNFPLRSEKFGYFEGGIRVPAFVLAPGRIPTERQGGSYNGLMHHVDLIGTFVHLGGGDESLYSDSDSLNHWNAIVGDTSSPRTEILLDAPRSNDWKLGESATSEGVVFRMGNYKMMINNAYDGWYAPHIDGGAVNYKDVYASSCELLWTSRSTVSDCTYKNWLFDIINDPNEKINLFEDSDYNAIKENMLTRVYEILAAEKNNYGQIIMAAYERGSSDTTYEESFEASGNYVVPFDCDAIY